MSRTLFAAGLALLVVAGEGFADLIYFAKGGQADLRSTTEGDQVRLETPQGPRTFPLGDFRKIVLTSSLESEWKSRQAEALKVGTVEARFAAAWWALENGLTSESLTALEELRPIASGHAPTRRAVAGIDSLKLPCPDPDLGPIRSRLRPLKFREVRSPHVVLLHQASDTEAKERLDVLERVVETFIIGFAAQGLELPAPTHRLTSVYFADKRDYAHFLRTVEASAFVEAQGYYHPNLRTVFAYDTRSGEAQKTGRRAIANRKRDGASASDLSRQDLLLDLDWRANDLGIAAHETVHLLTAETGLAPHVDDFPNWLHEGIAAQFEVVRGGRWAGVGRAHDLRLPDFRSIRPLPRIAPIVRDTGFGHGYKRDLYAESWALVYYLRKNRPREFLVFLDFLRSPGSASTTKSRPDRTFEAFRTAFGNDLGTLESDWRRFMSELKTPIEEAKPQIPTQAILIPKPESERRLVGEQPGH